METITIDKKAFIELMKIKEEFDLIMESIELSSDKEFMESLERSEEQIKNRNFADWDDLQNSSFIFA